MRLHLTIQEVNSLLTIQLHPPLPLHTIFVYVDGWLVGAFPTTYSIVLDKRKYGVGTHIVEIVGSYYGSSSHGTNHFYFTNSPLKQRNPQKPMYQPGDILISSDNVEIKNNYIGHSAIVVDENHIVESPGGHPALRKNTIENFKKKYHVYAQFRPKSASLGESAAEYALELLEKYEANLKEGIKQPIFSYDLSHDLKNPSETIYCSKLVWLCYYHGANFEFGTNYFWFAPEDLYDYLRKSHSFTLVYSHPDIKFKVNL